MSEVFNPGNRMKKHTLCWDCRHATNPEAACPWSREFIPVEGWKVKPVYYRGNASRYETYIVEECPLFERDAERFGLKRMERK